MYGSPIPVELYNAVVAKKSAGVFPDVDTYISTPSIPATSPEDTSNSKVLRTELFDNEIAGVTIHLSAVPGGVKSEGLPAKIAPA